MNLKIDDTQARRQDLAAGGAKNQKGGHILKIKYWMYAATDGPNVKWEGQRFQMGGPGTTGPSAGDGPDDTMPKIRNFSWATLTSVIRNFSRLGKLQYFW